MAYIPPNKKLYNDLTSKGLIMLYDDGAWYWSEKGKNLISELVRSLLSDLLYGTPVPKYMWRYLNEEGFNSEGFSDFSQED